MSAQDGVESAGYPGGSELRNVFHILRGQSLGTGGSVKIGIGGSVWVEYAYNKRWGVETTILTLKSYLQLALISATTQPGVAQDLWASFAFYNQQSALIAACQDEVETRTGHRKYDYRINRNVTAGLIQRFMYTIYLGGPNSWRAKTLVLLKLMPRYTNAYRPDRDQERKRKIMRANDRHLHEKNYRKAM